VKATEGQFGMTVTMSCTKVYEWVECSLRQWTNNDTCYGAVIDFDTELGRRIWNTEIPEFVQVNLKRSSVWKCRQEFRQKTGDSSYAWGIQISFESQ
jgi:hypothetical protein